MLRTMPLHPPVKFKIDSKVEICTKHFGRTIKLLAEKRLPSSQLLLILKRRAGFNSLSRKATRVAAGDRRSHFPAPTKPA